MDRVVLCLDDTSHQHSEAGGDGDAAIDHEDARDAAGDPVSGCDVAVPDGCEGNGKKIYHRREGPAAIPAEEWWISFGNPALLVLRLLTSSKSRLRRRSTR